MNKKWPFKKIEEANNQERLKGEKTVGDYYGKLQEVLDAAPGFKIFVYAKQPANAKPGFLQRQAELLMPQADDLRYARGEGHLKLKEGKNIKVIMGPLDKEGQNWIIAPADVVALEAEWERLQNKSKYKSPVKPAKTAGAAPERKEMDKDAEEVVKSFISDILTKHEIELGGGYFVNTHLSPQDAGYQTFLKAVKKTRFFKKITDHNLVILAGEELYNWWLKFISQDAKFKDLIPNAKRVGSKYFRLSINFNFIYINC